MQRAQERHVFVFRAAVQHEKETKKRGEPGRLTCLIERKVAQHARRECLLAWNGNNVRLRFAGVNAEKWCSHRWAGARLSQRHMENCVAIFRVFVQCLDSLGGRQHGQFDLAVLRFASYLLP